jgi:multiple sugar transport system ATP-binding protein
VQVRTEIKELHQRLRTTSVYVTHDQIEAMTMADKIVVLRDGQVEQVGSPLDLYDRPANTFVAGFIGSPAMNFLPGIVRGGAGAQQVALENGVTLAMPGWHATEGRRVLYGIRPEHLVLSTERQGLPVTVTVVEPTGADTLLIGRTGNSDVHAMFRERHAFAPGETVHLQPETGKVHLFDAQQGTRLAALH